MKRFSIPAMMVAAVALTACSAEVTDEGELPSMDVDVSAEAGEMPEVDVKTADVEIGTEEVTVDVPDVDVKMPSEQE